MKNDAISESTKQSYLELDNSNNSAWRPIVLGVVCGGKAEYKYSIWNK